jgi:tRNA threonylcarbamoyladenosine biosynthesis protein TsaB
MIDARRAEVYTAVYRNEGGELEPIVPSRAALLHELVSLLPDGAPVVVMGDGADKFRSYLAEKDPESVARFCVPARELRLCSAADVGLLGERELAAGHSADVALLEPLYVKDARSLLRPHRVGAAS